MANFSPVSQVEISPWPPEQIFLKTFVIRWRDFQPRLKSPARFVKQGWKFELRMKFIKISGNHIKISAWAEK